MAALSILEPLLGAFGDLLNDFGGLRQTRLRMPVATGATVLPLERVLGLPAQGLLLLDGTLYHYDAVDPGGSSVTGLYTRQLGSRVDGATMGHMRLAAVTDMSRTYSQLDALRNSYFIESAQGDDLAVAGRNYGLGRDPSISSDETYRKALLAIAFGPRGTMYGLQTALDAMLGPGKYSLREDTLAHPCQVFISTARDNMLLQSSLGRTYLAAPQEVAAQGQQLQLSPSTISATGAYRVGQDTIAECSAHKPSAAPVPWSYAGDDEASAVQLVDVGGGQQACQMTGHAAYSLPSRLNGRGSAYLGAVVRAANLASIPTTGSGTFTLAVSNARRAFTLGVKSAGSGLALVLMDQSHGVVAAAPSTFQATAFHEIGLRAHPDGRVEGVVDGIAQVVARETSFPSSSLGRLEAATSGEGGPWQLLRLYARTEDLTDYLNLLDDGAQTAAAAPRQLIDAAMDFLPSDAGRQMFVRGAAASATGLFRVASVDSPHSVTLTRGTFTGGRTGGDPANPGRLDAKGQVFDGPGDVGRTVTIAGGSNAGSYAVAYLLDVDGRRMSLRYPASSASAVLTHSDGSPATLQPQTEVSFSLDPVFGNASQLSTILVGASGLDASKRILVRQPLPDADSVYAVRASDNLGGQLVDSSLPAAFQTDDGPPVLFSAYPAYVSETLAFVQTYLSKLTAAGVRPVLDVT